MGKPHVHVPPGSRVTQRRAGWKRFLAFVGGTLLGLTALGFFSDGQIIAGAIVGFLSLGCFASAGAIEDR